MKKNPRQLASEVVASDALAKPLVAAPPVIEPAALAAEDDVEGGEEEARVKKSWERTTVESEEDDGNGEEASDDEDDEEEASEEEDDESAEGDDDKEEAVAASTSVEVLRTVRRITGETSPAKQLGALTAMAENAQEVRKLRARIAKAEKNASKTRVASMVDRAIAAGKLAPAQKAWALQQSAETLEGYLKNAQALVPRTPLRQKEPVDAKGAKSPTAGNGGPDAATAHVAALMGLDPALVAKHGEELRAKGVIH